MLVFLVSAPHVQQCRQLQQTLLNPCPAVLNTSSALLFACANFHSKAVQGICNSIGPILDCRRAAAQLLSGIVDGAAQSPILALETSVCQVTKDECKCFSDQMYAV